MQKLYFTTIAVLLLPLFLLAQFETDYKPLVCTGSLPRDFITLTSQKYQEAKSKLEESDNRNSKEAFLLSSNYAVDGILLSGKVLFNDPISAYLNKVADNALSSEPDLRKDLRFYVYKSTAVNAFSTNQGIVLVTTGLIAQLENEAELAFILCHEAVHYKEKHAMKQYLEDEKIAKGKGAYRQLDYEERMLARCTYSKEEEKEADQKGLEIFLRSKYSTQHLIGVYDVLKYAYLPFDDITFDKTFLENRYMKFPDAFYKNHTLAIETKDIDDEDPRSSHPSVLSRRQKTEDGIKGADNTGKMDFLVSEKDFNYIRELSRFELCRLYVLHDRYEMGMYNAYMLLKKYPSNIYLKKTVGFCLAGLAQYSNISSFREVHYNSDSIEGKSQALNYMMYCLDSMKNGALNVVALAYAVRLKSDYPQDEEVDELYKNLLTGLVTYNRLKYEDFSSKPYVAPEVKKDTTQQAVKTIDTTAVINEQATSKYEKLRAQKKEDVKRENEDPAFTKYAFVEYMDKPWFKNDFINAQDTARVNAEKKDDHVTIRFADEHYNYHRRYSNNNTPVALGINKLLIVTPEYIRINARVKDKNRYLQSEEGQLDLVSRLKLNAKFAHLDANVLSTKSLNDNETEKLNDVSVITDYINERLSHEENATVPYFERQRINEIAKKYNANNFMWAGVISLTDNSRSMKKLIAFTPVFPFIAPFTIPAIINAGQYTMYYAMVYDVQRDQLRMTTYREIHNRTRGGLLNSHIYDVFNQIKTQPKNK